MIQKGLAPILIILILAGVIALTFGVYYLGIRRSETLQQRVDKQNPVAPFTTPPQSSQTTSSTDETVYTEATRSANWKTYTSRFDFEFKYPSALGDLEDNGGRKIFIGNSKSSDCNKGEAVELNVIDNPKLLSITEFLNEYYKDFNSQAGYQYPVNKYLKDKPRLNTDIEWLINREPPLCPGKDVFLSNQDKIIKLFCANCSDYLIDNILYTFKFLK